MNFVGTILMGQSYFLPLKETVKVYFKMYVNRCEQNVFDTKKMSLHMIFIIKRVFHTFCSDDWCDKFARYRLFFFQTNDS